MDEILNRNMYDRFLFGTIAFYELRKRVYMLGRTFFEFLKREFYAGFCSEIGFFCKKQIGGKFEFGRQDFYEPHPHREDERGQENRQQQNSSFLFWFGERKRLIHIGEKK
ncbi:hypothetical protein K9M59_01325 [Candidatus Gracilibacteria bacterium]|nr:hypothetical protein [Candidatus Gracilibacteria bacterium]MCF7819209.1 hypothetical protein [Candidatus Gracilibacteria bacterium]